MNAMRPELLGRLLDAHGAALELYAAQWTDAAADIVQEAFVELIRRNRVPDRTVPWLYRVVRNRAINAARAAKVLWSSEGTAPMRFKPDSTPASAPAPSPTQAPTSGT